MKADILYGVFETTRKEGANDLTIGLAMYKAEHPELDMSFEEDKALRLFMARHYQKLVAAFRHRDREIFARTVEHCVKEDEEKARAAMDACHDGVCSIPGV